MISCICVTSARVRHLEEAIACFLAQDYAGECELIVFNTCPEQTLALNAPPPATRPVRVENLGKLPTTLGDARNTAIEMAQGTHIVTWDDDDAFLPHHLSVIAQAFERQRPDRPPSTDPETSRCQWIWLDKQFWGLGNTIKEIVPGQCPCFAFAKSAWKAVGGYPADLSVGEDRGFISKVTQQFPGNRFPVDGTPSFIYRWNNGVYHMSGQGDDRANRPKAIDRFRADALARLHCGSEPRGNVTVKPETRTNWVSLAKSYMDRELKKNSMNSVCIVQLGRFGDIINILPIALHVHNRFGTPRMMVSREFASVLEGVSYVDPYVVDLTNDQLKEAIALARKEFKHVIVTQIWGRDWEQERKCSAYNMESWRMAGFLSMFGNESLRPVFDRRDSARENSLVAKMSCGRKPILLVNLTASSSSPFAYGNIALGQIQKWFSGKFQIVNLAELRLHRIYDLLALMDKAVGLISIDTALLHLSVASKVPLLAILNPQPWLGTKLRRHAVTLTYTQAQNSGQLQTAIQQMVNCRLTLPSFNSLDMIHKAPPARRIFHVWEKHDETNQSEANRKGVARSSWKSLYDQGVIPVPLEVYPRDSRSFGEPRTLPFLKDCIEPAMKQADPDDIIFFTNDDNWLHPKLPEALRYHVALHDCCSSQRCEFHYRPMPPPSASPEEFSAMGEPHMGRDLFAFTAKWLRERWAVIPDFVLGASDWDLCIACIIRIHFGIQSTRKNLEECIHPAELPRGYVSHQYHPPYWNRASYCNFGPAQLHNRKAFFEWSRDNAPHLKFDKNLCI